MEKDFYRFDGNIFVTKKKYTLPDTHFIRSCIDF